MLYRVSIYHGVCVCVFILEVEVDQGIERSGE